MRKTMMLLGTIVGIAFNATSADYSTGGKDEHNRSWYYKEISSGCVAISGTGLDGDYVTTPGMLEWTVSSGSSSYPTTTKYSYKVVQIGFEYWTQIWGGGTSYYAQYQYYTDDMHLGTVTAKDITITNTILTIWNEAFYNCSSLKQVTIPSSVTYIGKDAFFGCSGLTNITVQGDMPTLAADTFAGTPRSMTITVGENSIGWDYYKKNGLTAPWEDRKVIKPGYPGSGDEPVSAIVALATTNVVIHYLTTNVPVNVVAPISRDTAIVNVMTEIEGGNIAIPDTWAKNYPDFTKRFGSDFSAALTKYTGKYDGAGNPLFVWQDYVAGTDPTDVYDVFTATITMVEGKPQVQWDPVLVETEAAKRVYTKYGKVKLTDEWEVIPEGEEGNYNFYRVTVRMK